VIYHDEILIIEVQIYGLLHLLSYRKNSSFLFIVPNASFRWFIMIFPIIYQIKKFAQFWLLIWHEIRITANVGFLLIRYRCAYCPVPSQSQSSSSMIILFLWNIIYLRWPIFCQFHVKKVNRFGQNLDRHQAV